MTGDSPSEARARQESRLAQLGGLFGGFAHEIRNPLSTIGLQLQLLQEEWERAATLARQEAATQGADAARDGGLARTEKSLKRLSVLQGEVRRLQNILDEFLRFVRSPELELSPVPLNQTVQAVVEFVEPELLRQGTVIRFLPDPRVPLLKVDPNQLRAAFLNLLINAQQALKQGGEIIVQTRLLGDRVLISFTDTGPGMTPEVTARCFTPYFTTKKGGSGLGLPTTRRIVEDHGGNIKVQSEPGRGTRFVIDLPVRGVQALPQPAAGGGQ